MINEHVFMKIDTLDKMYPNNKVHNNMLVKLAQKNLQGM